MPERALEIVDALELAAARIRAYHERQRPADADYRDDAGVRLGARWRPVDAAGLYVPGGRAAYPSSLLMNAIPAKGAGVGRLAMVTPTRSLSSVSDMRRSSSTRSSWTRMLMSGLPPPVRW